VAEPKIKKEELRVEEIGHAVMELAGLNKENYIAGIELSLSIYNANIKLLGKQMESWLALQHDYADLMKEFVGISWRRDGLAGGHSEKPFCRPT
jgi:hypothetical protein